MDVIDITEIIRIDDENYYKENGGSNPYKLEKAILHECSLELENIKKRVLMRTITREDALKRLGRVQDFVDVINSHYFTTLKGGDEE